MTFVVSLAATAAVAAGATGDASAALHVGSHGTAVRRLQLELAWHGFPSGRIDGAYGGHVAVAVRRFQRSVGLAVDGVAGQATLRALRLPPPRVRMPLGWPLFAAVGDRFGVRGRRFHAGIDLPAPRGTNVMAAAPGVVTWAGWRRGGWGRLVVVKHSAGVRTLYAHLASIAVRIGDVIAGGAVVGRVGATGDASGPHLHFEVRVGGAAVDPLLALAHSPGGRLRQAPAVDAAGRDG